MKKMSLDIDAAKIDGENLCINKYVRVQYMPEYISKSNNIFRNSANSLIPNYFYQIFARRNRCFDL